MTLAHPRRLVYLGTPAMAVPPLEALVAAGHDVALVVTSPDRKRGRGGALSPTPVKAAAQALGLPVSHNIDDVTAMGADLGVVVAFGRLIRPHVLAAVPMVNLHFSLLPRWRGAAPVERAILAGDTETGVCLMRLEEGLDTGPVLDTVRVPIGASTTADELRRDLVRVGMVRDQVQWMLDLLGDPRRTGLVVVTTPEELPVSESIDLVERIRASTAVDVAAIVANRVPSQWFPPADAARRRRRA